MQGKSGYIVETVGRAVFSDLATYLSKSMTVFHEFGDHTHHLLLL
jgi:hypothetical protein